MCALVTGVQTCALPIYAVLRTGLARWLDRLALPATVRFRRLLRGSARHARERLLAHRAGRRAGGRLPPLPPGTTILETTFETDEGAVTLIEFMPLASPEEHVNVVRPVPGDRGRGGMLCAFVLRCGYGST